MTEFITAVIGISVYIFCGVTIGVLTHNMVYDNVPLRDIDGIGIMAGILWPFVVSVMYPVCFCIVFGIKLGKLLSKPFQKKDSNSISVVIERSSKQ